LLDLIGLRQRASRLEIEDFGNAHAGENVVASFDSRSKSQPGKKGAEFPETNVRI
jgi:hypothetical protein